MKLSHRFTSSPTSIAWSHSGQDGVDAYLGTYWPVNDGAAGRFAAAVYCGLMAGDTLETAVRRARASLFDARSPDWANHVLYGDGSFRVRLADGAVPPNCPE